MRVFYTEVLKFYSEEWRVNAVTRRSSSKSDAFKWKTLAEKRAATRELLRYSEKNYSKTIIFTGPYQLDADTPLLVVDIDDVPLSREQLREYAKQYARSGIPTAITRRGLHLHVRVKRSEAPYMLVIMRDEEKAGEGASLQPHMWTTPPATVYDADTLTRTRYVYVYPSGEEAGFPPEPRTPALYTMSELKQLLDDTLGLTVRTVSGSHARRGEVHPDEVGARLYPIFRDKDEFVTRLPELPVLPPVPVAWVLRNYALNTGMHTVAEKVERRFKYVRSLPRLVPHGQRFLVSAEFALFYASTVTHARFDDINEILANAVEDYPANPGGTPLDKALRYLLLTDDQGYVLPRYGGIGSMRPASLCVRCPYRAACEERAVPWRYFWWFARKFASVRRR